MGSFGSAFHDSINVGIPDDFTIGINLRDFV